MSPESVQLAYQICVQGRSDLALAPDEATGFAMTLLRLRAFEPATVPTEAEHAGAAGAGREATPPVERPSHAANVARASPSLSIPRDGKDAPPDARLAVESSDTRLALPETAGEWPAFVAKLRLIGMAAQLGAQSELKSVRGNALTLAIPASHKHLADKAYADKLKAALEATTGRKLLLAFEIGDSSDTSLAAIERRERARAKAEGEVAFRNEPFVRDLVAKFDATIRPETIEPVTRGAEAPPSIRTRQETP